MENNMRKKVAFYLPNLAGGGVSGAVVNLMNQLTFSKEVEVLMVLNKKEGEFLRYLDSNIEIFELDTKRLRDSLFSLLKFLKKIKPDVLISGQSHVNTIALMANQMLRKKIKVIITEHGNLQEGLKDVRNPTKIILLTLMKNFYPKADKVISVSKGVEKTLLKYIKMDKSKMEVIYNPIISDLIYERAEEPLNHKWFTSKEIPVILSVGRLSKEKDFENLLQAFSIVKSKVDSRLLIVGEGPERDHLEKLIKKLDLQDSVDLYGFEENPYKFFKNADLFVLSSKTEGLGNVLVEALCLRRKIVSTDCPSGPEEVLKKGKFGKLVPPEDTLKLAEGIIDQLKQPTSEIPNNNELEEWLKEFEVNYVTERYLNLIKK
jgi:glycosyltransferase involved in cell wall biosynthesis